ncbi:MAG: sigma factor regulator FecR [Syntrophales bacterium]|jgi:mono-ADP-ribosyltransferase sirtuin 6|nr:sigma factor regulator FecR [Syntrophales bacterium]MDY0044789.1 Sir2 family NAD-dependent protein deacetylase [Syntrophales bacterium]
MKNDLDRRISILARWIHEASYPVYFAGAGISTDSGIPDYRGPDGLWTRRDRGLAPKPMSKPWDQVAPNPGHCALVDLQNLGKLRFLISQNVDNLHLKSGIRQDLLAELHGNMALLRCTRCEETLPRAEGSDVCRCGGRLKSSIVDFGDALPHRDLNSAFTHSRRSDLFVVVGSSLVVTPAANMPMEALRSGAKLVIINKGETPFDSSAHLRFDEPISSVLPRTVRQLKRLMGMFE